MSVIRVLIVDDHAVVRSGLRLLLEREEDMDLVQTIRNAFGHIDCGVYARIEAGGRLALGDAVELQ